MTQETELLPCPFCGATPHAEKTKFIERPNSGDKYQKFVFRCPHGHARVEHEELVEVIKTWNTRAHVGKGQTKPVEVGELMDTIQPHAHTRDIAQAILSCYNVTKKEEV